MINDFHGYRDLGGVTAAVGARQSEAVSQGGGAYLVFDRVPLRAKGLDLLFHALAVDPC